MLLLHAKINIIKAYLTKKIQEKDFLISVLEESKDFMVEGKYSVTWTGKRKIYLKNKNTKEFLAKNRHQSNDSSLSMIKYLIDTIAAVFFTIMITHRQKPSMEGELLMMTYSNNVKIIDFKNKVVINKMKADPLTYSRISRGYQSLGNYFKMTIIDFMDDELMYLEKYLEFIPYRHWETADREKCFIEIFNCYISYFASLEQGEQISRKPREILQKLEGSSIGKHKLFFKLNEWLRELPEEAAFPAVRSHGDMKFENILLAEETFYVIDLEFSADYFFLYDVVNLLFNEAMNADYSYLEAYLNGDYNTSYKKVFEAFSLDFADEKKLSYIAIYLIDRIYHFDMKVTAKRGGMDGMLDYYFTVMRKIEEMNLEVVKAQY